ncbi:MAG: sensor histidine kinase [Microcoleaceae cyanobacterium]
MFQATRRRLAIWYTSVTAVLLLLFVSGFYLYVRQTLVERVDDTLNHVVEVVERSLVIKSIGDHQWQVNTEASFRNNTTATEDDRIDLEWFSPTGQLIWSTFAEPLRLPLHPNRHETVRANWKGSDEARLGSSELLLRQVTDRVQKGRQVLGYLRVSHPWFEVTKPSRQLMLDLLLGLILTVTSVGTIGWLLSGLAIDPIRDAFQQLKQFTADASHELRNPIATIQTNVQVALAEPDLPPEDRQQLQVIERITRRLGGLVDDLLFLARQDSGLSTAPWTEIHLDALLLEVIEEQEGLANIQGIDLQFDLAEESCFTLLGDWNQLVRLFTNVIENAVQYTPAGGEVKVYLKTFPVNGSKLKRQSIKSEIQVTVQDTGIGIPPESLSQVFNRFYRVDPNRSRQHSNQHFTQQSTGSGLGLAIAQAIVDNHHGQIQIESQLNQGTTLRILLPGYSSQEQI